MPSLTRAQLKALFHDQRDRLYRMLLRLCGNAQDAEDLLQETFLVVWRKRAQFEGRGAPEGFLRTTAMRLFLNTRQAAAARPSTGASLDEADQRPDPAQPSPSQSLTNQDALRFLVARIDEGLDSLAPEAREAFVLFRYENLSIKEIAELTGVPPKTVETRLRRATLVLADKLRPFHYLLPAS